MKSNFFVTAFLIISCFIQANAQSLDTQVLSPPSSKFSFGVEFNIGQTTPTYINDGTVPIDVQEVFEDIEFGILAYEIGLLTEYKISRHLGIQTGIKYLSWGYKNSQNLVILPVPPFEMPHRMDLIYRNTYVAIPIQSNIYFNIKPMQLLLRTGLAPTVTLQHSRMTKMYFTNHIETTVGYDDSTTFRTVNLNAEFGVGLAFDVHENVNICLLPNVKFQSLGIANNEPLNRRFLFYGVSLITKLH